MSRYIINIGEELVFAMKAGSTCQPEQFVDYSANIDFWFHEFRHLQTLVEQYEQRQALSSHALATHFPDSNASSRDTSSPREREIVVREARENLIKLINRGKELQLIPIETYNAMLAEMS